MVTFLTQHHVVSVGSTRIIHVNYTTDLENLGVGIDSATVVEDGTSDLNIQNVKVTTTSYYDRNSRKTVLAGKAVEFTVAQDSPAAATYTIIVTATTDGSPSEDIPYGIKITFE